MALRLLSYNILRGGEDCLPLIARVIRHQQPDVVALLEVTSRDNAEALAQELGMNLTLAEANNGRDNVAWLSRFPVIHTKNYRLPVFAKTLLKIEILWEEMHLALFATHLKAGLEQEPRRVAEIEVILTCLQSLEDRPHLLVGDLNTLHPRDQPNIPTYLATATWEKRKELSEDELPRQTIPLLLKAGYIDCYRALHPTAPGYTCQSTNPALRIDYIFASPTFARHLHACDVVTGGDTEMASDHYPIWAEFN